MQRAGRRPREHRPAVSEALACPRSAAIPDHRRQGRGPSGSDTRGRARHGVCLPAPAQLWVSWAAAGEPPAQQACAPMDWRRVQERAKAERLCVTAGRVARAWPRRGQRGAPVGRSFVLPGAARAPPRTCASAARCASAPSAPCSLVDAGHPRLAPCLDRLTDLCSLSEGRRTVARSRSRSWAAPVAGRLRRRHAPANAAAPASATS
jgi:hypothetical protein